MSLVSIYAPGRAELLGNHTDYNEGLVLSLAVNRGTTITASPLPDGRLRFHSLDLDQTWEGSLGDLEPLTEMTWCNYLLGVFHELLRRGVHLEGAEMTLSSNLPIGAGLSSSASVEIATVLALQKMYPFAMEDMEIARVGQAAEHLYAGVKCGLLDQISVLMSRAGHATHIDCRSMEVRHLPVPERARFVIVHSGVKHALVAGEYNERRASCEAAARTLGKKALRDATSGELEARAGELDEKALKRARHVVGENERVAQAVGLLAAGRIEDFGVLMTASHRSSIENFENSCPELDFLVETALGLEGCMGARLSGGGFGGATINLVDRDHEQEFTQGIRDAYAQKHGNAPMVLSTPAADGARAG